MVRGRSAEFLHLLRLLEAERAWAMGDFGAAALAFDAARDDAAGRQRPWHRALIVERAGRFALARGLQHAGYELLAQARNCYLAWGAAAKVAQLDWAFPALGPQAGASGETGHPAGEHASMLSTGTIDLQAVLSASQALSSETTIEGLRSRVAGVLAAMTGATSVQLLLWRDDRRQWLLPKSTGGTVAVSARGHDRAVPMSVLRYTERTSEPLVVADAGCDDRFARDPYFADVDRCSLLALPIISRGSLRAVALLENRLIRGAFTAERLDAVMLIAAQLAVSLDNAQLYDELAMSRARVVTAADHSRRRIERDLHDGAQQRLVSLALQLRLMQEVAPEGGEVRKQLDRSLAEATGALEDLRHLSRGIHPAMLSDRGLGSALRALIRRSPIPVQLELGIEDRLPDEVEVSAYYIVAEALTNAAKHSDATEITVVVGPGSGTSLRLEVSDDGVGGADFSCGTGLLGLKDRAEALSGSIDLSSPRGGGTTLRVVLPLTQPNGDAAGESVAQ